MPKVLADYSHTFIYKICCKDPSIQDIYVGHTTNIAQRKNNHRMTCCNPNSKNYNLFVYKFIRDNGGWENWLMIPIEELNCKNKIEASIRERYWIDSLKSKLNSNNSFASKEEKEKQKQNWYLENKEQILQKAKERYEENKEEILEKVKQYAEQNKDKIAENQKIYRENHKQELSEQKKIYRESHKETAANANKEWREANKQKLQEQRAQIIHCGCGHSYTFGNKSRHLHTKVHMEYENPELCKNPISEEEQKAIEEEKKCKMREQQKIYRETHAEQIKQGKKLHYQENKESILEQQRKYKELHKEEFLEQTKKYVEENKEKIRETKSKWYEENKSKLLQKQKELITCECGAQIRKTGKQEHLTSKKHKDYYGIQN